MSVLRSVSNDDQPPDIAVPRTTVELDPAAPNGRNGWYRTAVHLTVGASDNTGGSGVAETRCVLDPASVPDSFDDLPAGCDYTGSGADVGADGQHVLYAASVDAQGNEETPLVSKQFKIDTTAPTIVVASARKADGSAYTAGTWTNQSVTVSYTCSDGTGSGVASCPADETFSGDGADQSASGTATDNAGNTASATFGDIDIDRTKPSVTCDTPSPTFVLGGPGGNVTATVTDATSGPVSENLSDAAIVSPVGNKSVSLTGSDNAGNSTTLSCPYTVGYNFVGPFSPIPQSTYKVGSTIPVKFALANAAGTRITDAAARALVASPCKVKVSLEGGTKNCASYNATTNTFQYNLKVPKNLSSGTHAIVVEVSAPDGSGVVNKESVEVTIRR